MKPSLYSGIKPSFSSALLLLASCLAGDAFGDSTPALAKNYSYLYFENGYPTRSGDRRPQSDANLAARANPDLVFQTGYYSLMLDCDDIDLKGYDPLAGSDYFSALNQDVTVFSPASTFLLRVQQGGVDYTCTGALVQASGIDNVRLVESGQYVKRIDHTGLIFKDAQGNELVVDETCRLEITAWPDRVTFLLDSSRETNNPITRSTIQIISPDGVSHLVDDLSNQARLTLKPQEDAKLTTLNPADFVTLATNLQNDTALTVSFDADTHSFAIDVPADAVRYPSAVNRVDEYRIELSNPLSTAVNIPLRFIQPNPRAITGTVMLLSDADSGRPLGIPVQISKNWHGNSANVHEGQWLRGSTMLTLQAGESQRIKLRVAYGYWGGAGTVSHNQLSLIGYGGNWKWDESALGAWGEALTVDPTQHLGGAFLDDIRPSFTQSYDNSGAYKDPGLVNTTHNWTENVGGGDFLIYRDSANSYHRLKRLKTCYYQTGPNLTEVHYSGLTDDGKIRANYTSRMVSTLDYHRRFHSYQYQFLEDVTNPERLVFYQMAADYYNTAVYSNFHIGDSNGLLNSVDINDPSDPMAGGNSYKGLPIAMDGKWLSIEDTTGSGTSYPAKALRGLIPLSSTLNGTAFPLYVHPYGRSFTTNSVLFDFSANSVSRSYLAGDVVTGELAFIMPPKHRDNYWGSDGELIARLTSYGDATWEPVRDEQVENIGMTVSVHQGTLLNNYPLEIQSTSGNRVLTDLTIESGGIGHVPLLLRGADAGLELRLQRYSSGAWVDLESVDIANDTYYQAVQNANGTMDYAFNIPRPSSQHDLNTPWRIRVLYAQFPRIDPPAQEALSLASADAVSDRGYVYYGDVQFIRHPESAWTLSAGTLSNNSTVNSYVSEGAMGRTVAVNSLAVSQGNLVTLSFDYNLSDPAEILYVHLWGLVGTVADNSLIMNLAAQDGSAWYYSNEGIDMYNLADGVATIGAASTAAVSLSGTTGPQSFSGTFDLSAFIEAANDLSDFDTLVLGFARKINGATTPAASISNIKLWANSKGEDEVPFEKWASDLALTSAAAADDPDGDGLNNFREFALGGNPTQSTSTGVRPFQRKVQDGGSEYLEFVYRRRVRSDNTLNYILQTSTDLSPDSWTNSGFVELPAVDTEDPDFQEVTSRMDTSSAPKAFMRLRIQAPE